MSEGTCRLTGERGKYVKSHLIPLAFTKPEEKDRPLIQSGSGKRAIKRWSSWYDNQLVTSKGEEILALLDDWAVDLLRAQRLVWSGWGPMLSLGTYHKQLHERGWGVRSLECNSPDRLRLFFLSLLWRAAATRRSEFDEVSLPPDDLETLRMVLLGTAEPALSFYPVTLVQLSTLGTIHNMGPIAQTKWVPGIDAEPEREIPIFRFYFDGLIAHFHRHANDDGYTEGLGPLVVGADNTLVINTVPYEASFERKNLQFVVAETVSFPRGFPRPPLDEL